ncbi:MAG: sigma-54-dependent Fis family transcriptional regulator [Deltaproteobacteria bacterium]|nr:sigma-54-dependent Fis family transcriptional regulator [Deltaproteobacteria bacterium]
MGKPEEKSQENREEKPTSILVIDDEEIICSCLAMLFDVHGFDVGIANTAEDAWDMLQRYRYDLVILDIMLPGIDGIALLKKIQRQFPNLPVIMLSAIDNSATVVEAMQAGAWDYARKPYDNNELLLVVENVLAEKSLREEQRRLESRLPNKGLRKIVSQSAAMTRVKEIIEQIADTDVTVLIHGDTGVGKELVANRIHFLSNRADKPFVKINCAALPENLLESELFGFERGAFTGALRSKPGKFELAGDGSIFLDEIGEMSLTLQAKLLQVLQDKVCSRLGGTREIPVNCRVLAATNINLEEAIAKGGFRADLYYRLNVVNIYVPSLASRKEDIPLLAEYFLKYYNELYGKRRKISFKIIDQLMAYDWPGNVRELENWMRRFVILGSGSGWQEAAELAGREPEKPALEDDYSIDVDAIINNENFSLRQLVRQMVVHEERALLLKTLERVNYNRKKAARLLHVSYKAFLYKLKECGIDKVKLKGS